MQLFSKLYCFYKSSILMEEPLFLYSEHILNGNRVEFGMFFMQFLVI